jgi:PIN domain
MATNPINVVLIDYENVQPQDLKRLEGGAFKVIVFLGQNQSKISVELAAALQPLGTNADYVQLEAGGSNALDFHIAFYLGELSCQLAKAVFHVISKDKGFDPLIKHLRGKGVSVERNECIAHMSYFDDATIDAQVRAVISDLVGHKSSKPRSIKTLRSTMHALFKKETSESQLTTLVEHLRKQGIIKVEGVKVSYQLPSQAA